MDWLNGLWDKATGVFDRIADIEVAKYEAKNSLSDPFGGGSGGSFNTPAAYPAGTGINPNYIALGLLAVIAFFVLKK